MTTTAGGASCCICARAHAARCCCSCRLSLCSCRSWGSISAHCFSSRGGAVTGPTANGEGEELLGAIASQAAISIQGSDGRVGLRATGQIVLFDGFLKLYREGRDDNGGASAPDDALNLSAAGDIIEAAANLFAYLRRLDASGTQTIAVMPIPESGLGRAINDRLRRAANRQ